MRCGATSICDFCFLTFWPQFEIFFCQNILFRFPKRFRCLGWKQIHYFWRFSCSGIYRQGFEQIQIENACVKVWTWKCESESKSVKVKLWKCEIDSVKVILWSNYITFESLAAQEFTDRNLNKFKLRLACLNVWKWKFESVKVKGWKLKVKVWKWNWKCESEIV